MLCRIIYGTRISLTVGLIGITFSFVLGIVIGGLAGYYGGWIDNSLSASSRCCAPSPNCRSGWRCRRRSGDLEPDPIYFGITLILGLLDWTGLARAVRSKLLALREEDFCTAAELMGARAPRIIGRHLLPSFMSHLIASATLSIPG